ncbi:hypothetical protein CAPTEDRAFT_216842 [Capitella teleta]|uniref:UPAR/Ly6 domain-containing protein n=1 Tax=Capitella teleta TaxID=283909 RepID=R7UBP5_CAPTE|nr:hypothetical protein CAPTEDRAFT_216842 [Capitella teleta]|eukprot:ELU03795.1 hypothetical protein CAPTEDRAFT_216842 [Capitella teleta]
MQWVIIRAFAAVVVFIDTVSAGFCWGCTGHHCLQNPADPSLFPGKVKCHDVMEYCSTHIRYLVNNQSLASGKALFPGDYRPQSVTRQCAKVWLGNLCRRDWLGPPQITCISTCEGDLCNCGSRSPPTAMFKNGSVLFESPKRSKFKATDMLSCHAVRSSPGFGGRAVPMDDYEYYNDVAYKRRLRNRHSGSATLSAEIVSILWLLVFVITGNTQD